MRCIGRRRCEGDGAVARIALRQSLGGHQEPAKLVRTHETVHVPDGGASVSVGADEIAYTATDRGLDGAIGRVLENIAQHSDGMPALVGIGGHEGIKGLETHPEWHILIGEEDLRQGIG